MAVGAIIACAASAFGKQYSIAPINNTTWGTTAQEAIAANDAYTVFTGLATATNSLTLTENAAGPVRDDLVLFDGTEEQINDYLDVLPPLLAGQRRFVTESTVDNGNGTRTDTITVRAVAADTNDPADLWPQGLSSGGTPLPNGGFGLGLNMGPLGNSPVNLDPGSTVISATVDITSDGVPSGPLNLPLATFFTPSPSNWNGMIGIAFSGGASDAAIDSSITFKITTSVPEPASLGLLGFGGLFLARRWHRC
ncbi:MAG TPA: PEP-CTERM sorting domain-containing protein [Tepidisphaeraceae bacterium]